ncbi:MAG: HD domain-containing protein [Flavobacteriales bacterium]|nr:HD domain-containing protein [Flavobacteriales bacterium]
MPARFDLARQHVSEIFSQQFQSEIVYHTYAHTLSVLLVLDKLCAEEKISDQHWHLLRLAALFHDCGFSVQGEEHEAHSAVLVSKFMMEHNYTEEETQLVKRCIMTTALVDEPDDLYEQILRDADLHYLGTTDYFRQADLLRKEWEATAGKVMSDKEWYSTNLDFFNQHSYYTASAKKLYDAQKEINFREITSRLQSIAP